MINHNKTLEKCKVCGRLLEKDEIALHRKLLGRDDKEFYCIPCLAKEFEKDTDWLWDLVETYRYQGCALFE